MRRATIVLQDIALTCDEITEEEVLKRFPTLNIKSAKKMLVNAVKGDIEEAYKTLDDIYYNYGYSGTEILNSMWYVIKDTDMSQKSRFKLITYIAEIDNRIMNGANEVLQIQSVLEYIHNLKES
jgi:replication factor C small subunit